MLIPLSAFKIPAAAQHQRLVQGLLEPMVTLFHVSVLVRAGRPDCPAFQPVVFQQRPIRPRENLLMSDVLDGRCQPVRLVRFGHAPKLPERPLQTRAETLETLGKT